MGYTIGQDCTYDHVVLGNGEYLLVGGAGIAQGEGWGFDFWLVKIDVAKLTTQTTSTTGTPGFEVVPIVTSITVSGLYLMARKKKRQI
ncbi:MAG: hypothetical protein ACW967_04515 [Candidatus Hodarchaeales archaeon]